MAVTRKRKTDRKSCGSIKQRPENKSKRGHIKVLRKKVVE
ncbi:hypothetical protein SPV1_05253 [Mariprofundus ferrooxydans PV-1]|uniref:Uncharacterized protein n=1 Tax=Mariprofundus ferrooxydans PV-1 TaxID=314345 RepID=Q0F2U0_9PROT|nr:hypothetical protein SPV1_05253 [Mariprofundus ferrooxydans PV-1]